MWRFFLIISLLISTTHARAQENFYRHQLSFHQDSAKLRARSVIRLSADVMKQDSLLLHIPSRALEWKNSSLQQQFRRFQNASPYFAEATENGRIKWHTVQLGSRTINLCKECEFAKIPLKNTTADQLILSYSIYLPRNDYFYQGVKEKSIRISDWLPRIAMLRHDGWHPSPVDFFGNAALPSDSFSVNFEIPASFTLATNAKILDQDQLGNSEKVSERKTLHLSHTGANLQFVLSENFYHWQMQGKKVYATTEKPWLQGLLKSSNRRISEFLYSETGDSLNDFHTLLFLEDGVGNFQSDQMLSLNMPKDNFELESHLVWARAESVFRYKLGIDGIRLAWLAKGLPFALKQWFVKKYHPKEKWLPLSTSFLGRFFNLDKLDYSFKNKFFYLYLARQGLDQKIASPADSLTRLNYRAIAESKSYMALNHLRHYVGHKDFRRSVRRFLERNRDTTDQEQLLQKSLQYYSPKPVDWFFGDFIHTSKIYDYKLQKIDHCPTVATATIKNKGHIAPPYSLTGYKNGEKIITEWHEGHLGAKTVQTYYEKFDRVVINEHQLQPEFSQKNNEINKDWLFKKFEPIRLQFYNGFEAPGRSELYWLPVANYNAYDKLLVGAALYNEAIVDKRLEYVIAPYYSTGTGKITGNASLVYNDVYDSDAFFRSGTYGIYGRYFHYDRDLSFSRISPTVRLRIRKPFPQSRLIQSLRFRLVSMDRELPADFDGQANQLNTASYTVFEASYEREDTDLLRPTTLKADLQFGDLFGKLQASYDQRWMLPNRKWLIWRNFGGLFLYNQFLDQGFRDNFYSFGLGGTRDYLFDYDFYGRSDSTSIWAQQMFITDGGFKSRTPVFADRWMLSSNVSIPVWSVFGLFGDAALADNFDQVYYDYGFRLALFTDFFEVYFPAGNQDEFLLDNEGYFNEMRFLIDLDLSRIIDRLRRGYY